MVGLSPSDKPPDTPIGFADRRRVDRREYSDPALIALLRGPSAGQPAHALQQVPATDEQMNRRLLIRGIRWAMLLATAFWAGLAFIVWSLWLR